MHKTLLSLSLFNMSGSNFGESYQLKIFRDAYPNINDARSRVNKFVHRFGNIETKASVSADWKTWGEHDAGFLLIINESGVLIESRWFESPRVATTKPILASPAVETKEPAPPSDDQGIRILGAITFPDLPIISTLEKRLARKLWRCTTCRNSEKPNQVWIHLRCGHLYHEGCIDRSTFPCSACQTDFGKVSSVIGPKQVLKRGSGF